jgi:hypothetical protein
MRRSIPRLSNFGRGRVVSWIAGGKGDLAARGRRFVMLCGVIAMAGTTSGCAPMLPLMGLNGALETGHKLLDKVSKRSPDYTALVSRGGVDGVGEGWDHQLDIGMSCDLDLKIGAAAGESSWSYACQPTEKIFKDHPEAIEKLKAEAKPRECMVDAEGDAVVETLDMFGSRRWDFAREELTLHTDFGEGYDVRVKFKDLPPAAAARMNVMREALKKNVHTKPVDPDTGFFGRR